MASITSAASSIFNIVTTVANTADSTITDAANIGGRYLRKAAAVQEETLVASVANKIAQVEHEIDQDWKRLGINNADKKKYLERAKKALASKD